MLQRSGAHVLEAITGLFPSQRCRGFMYRAWDHVCLIWDTGCKEVSLDKMQPACSTAVWVLQAREHGQFPWDLWESLGLIAAESTRSKPTFPVLSLTGIWRSLAVWCGMAVAFPVPGSAGSGQGGIVIIPSEQHLLKASSAHWGQRFLNSEVKCN